MLADNASISNSFQFQVGVKDHIIATHSYLNLDVKFTVDTPQYESREDQLSKPTTILKTVAPQTKALLFLTTWLPLLAAPLRSSIV